MGNKNLIIVKNNVTKATNAADELVIKNNEELSKATELLVKIKLVAKQVKQEMEKLTKPAKAIIAEAKAKYEPFLDNCEQAEAIVKQKMVAYNLEVQAEARKAEEKILQDFGVGKIKKIETVAKKIDEIEKTQSSVHVDQGSVQFKTIKKVRIVNPNLVPDEYWILNEVLIRKEALAGKEIPGVEIFEEQIVASSTF